MKIYELAVHPYKGNPDMYYLVVEGQAQGLYDERTKNAEGGLERIVPVLFKKNMERTKYWELGKHSRITIRELKEDEAKKIIGYINPGRLPHEQYSFSKTLNTTK